MCGNENCNCGNNPYCGDCEPWNCVEQAVNDVWSTKKGQIKNLVDRADTAAENSEASAKASADSAAEAKEFRDEAEQAASTAVAAEGIVLGVANDLQNTANSLNNAVAGIAVASWFYTTVTENQTVIPVPADKNALDVQAIYIEGLRQSPFRGFEFDKTAMTITLAEPLPLGLEIEIILGIYDPDNPNDFAYTLASDNGAKLVGTKNSRTVQDVLTSLGSEGYDYLDSFQAGTTLTRPNQALRDTSTGKYYRWDGVFPSGGKIVPAGSTPANSGGVGIGAWMSAGDDVLRQELSNRGGSGLITDLFKPVTWAQFAGGVDPTGANDSTAAFNAAYDAAENGIGILVPKGLYNEGGTTKEVRSDSLWLSRDFGLGVGIATETRKSPLLITVGNPDEPVLNSEYTRSGINITAVGRGGQHIDCIRATTINYSTNGNGNTAIYAAGLSTPGALWTAALHGEIKHQGNSTIAISAEAASYSATGTFYGLVLNNTTSTAAETHPSTGAPATLHPSATALYITGSVQRGEMGQWIRGIRFSPLSMREAGTLVRDESACAQGWWSTPTSSKSNADILLEGTAPQGIIIQGTYPTGNGIRLGSGIGIAYEGTGAIKTKYDRSTLRWGLFSGASERVTFHTATPGMYFNGVRVVAGQQAAIPNATAETVVTVLNLLLAANRNHGLIAS
jgi:hypothetical protein